MFLNTLVSFAISLLSKHFCYLSQATYESAYHSLFAQDRLPYWKNIFPDDFPLKNLSLSHIRNTKRSQAMETGKFENSFKSKSEKTEVPWGSSSYHIYTVLRTALCVQNKQGDLQQITGVLTRASKNWGKQERKRTCIQVYAQTVCRLKVIFIKACTCRRSRLVICWQKDKSPVDLPMYFYSKNTHCLIEKNAAVNTWILTYGGVWVLPTLVCSLVAFLFLYWLCIAQMLAFLTFRLISMCSFV